MHFETRRHFYFCCGGELLSSLEVSVGSRQMHNILTSLVWFLLIIIAVALILLLIAALTGRTTRAYSVLSETDSLKINGRSISVPDLAAAYRPWMYLRKNTPSPPLMWVWYEVVQNQSSVDLVYYHAWENEINPNGAFHFWYSIYRSAYYGYPLYDIEYFQLSVSPLDGSITGLMFETSPGDDYFVTLSEHLVARYIRNPAGSYDQILSSREGQEKSRSTGLSVPMEGTHPLVVAQTWNHLSRFLADSDSPVEKLDAPLKFLSAADYTHYKFARKSQGDHKTKEVGIQLVLQSLIIFILFTLPAGFIYIFWRKKKTRSSDL
jgi:hypothetical protein